MDSGVVPTRNHITVTREAVKGLTREGKGQQPALALRFSGVIQHISSRPGQPGQGEEHFSVPPSLREGRDVPWGPSSLQKGDLNFCTFHITPSSPTGLKSVVNFFLSNLNLFGCWLKSFLMKHNLQGRVDQGKESYVYSPKVCLSSEPVFWYMKREGPFPVPPHRKEERMSVLENSLQTGNVMCLWRENLINIQEQQWVWMCFIKRQAIWRTVEERSSNTSKCPIPEDQISRIF